MSHGGSDVTGDVTRANMTRVDRTGLGGRPEPAPFQAWASPWRIAVGILGGIAFFAVSGYGMVQQRVLPLLELRYLGWLFVAFAAIGTVVGVPLALRRMFDRRPQVRIDASGIWARAWRFDAVPWSEVAAVRVLHRTGNQRLMFGLAVDLHNPGPWIDRLPTLSKRSREYLIRNGRWADFGDLNVTFNGLRPGLAAAVHYVADDLGRPVDDPNA